MTTKHVEINKKVYKKPRRFFEDSGTVNPEEAYYVPLDNVTNRKKQDIQTMIDLGRYFSIFAPRQSGKTTFFEEICAHLHNDPTYVAIILSFDQYTDLSRSYKERRYIIETKINRQNLTRTLKDGIAQVSGKYLASESVTGGYLVIFDIKTQLGEECEPRYHQVGNQKVTSFTIGIGRPD
jgi:hypothetical protein